MSDNSPPTTNDGKEALSLLEKLVDIRMLVLALCLIFYIDIWMLKSGLNPTVVNLGELTDKVKFVPVFTLLLFILSFSLLMVATFPALRKIIGLVGDKVLNRESPKYTRPIEQKRLSDWSLGFVLLSLYDATLGFQVNEHYRGLSIYLGSLIAAEGFTILIFRCTAIIFFLLCVALALERD